jgi:uncharacterized membrane protein
MTTSSRAESQKLASQPQTVTRDWLRILGMLLAVAGFIISSYLSYVKLADAELVCVKSSSLDCSAVQDSVYSEIAGIPIAILGMGAYFGLFALLALESRLELVDLYGRSLLFLMTLVGVLYSAYLTYIEAFVLEKWCQYCVGSAMIMVALFVIAGIRVFSMDEDEFFVDDLIE